MSPGFGSWRLRSPRWTICFVPSSNSGCRCRKKQIQPQKGPEKAFGQALREIREGKEISQERLVPPSRNHAPDGATPRCQGIERGWTENDTVSRLPGIRAAAGLDRSFLSMVERGIQNPNLVVLFEIAEILQVPASELIVRTETALGSTPHPNANHR